MKKQVAVLFGGRSAEHEISVITGLEVISAMDSERYQAHPVYIDLRGRWFTGPQLLKKDFYRGLPGNLAELKEVCLLPVPGIGGLTELGKKPSLNPFAAKKSEVLPIDVYLPIFHGQFGEDGCIQGLFEMADVVYAGSSVPASAIAMNKYHCKSVLHAHGIPVLPAIVIGKQEARRDLAGTRQKILSARGLEQFPLFVKPVNLGSSVGVSRANDAAQLDAALARVFEVDTEALIEPCVANLMEINVAVLEGSPDPVASVVEIPVASKEVLTYEDKYMRGGKGKKGGAQRLSGMAGLTRVIDPDDLEPAIRERVRSSAVEAFKVLGCAGVSRLDYMLDLDTGGLYFNEINPIPGSMAFYLWEKSQPPILYTEMITRIIEGAVERREQRAGLKRDMGFKAMFA